MTWEIVNPVNYLAARGDRLNHPLLQLFRNNLVVLIEQLWILLEPFEVA